MLILYKQEFAFSLKIDSVCDLSSWNSSFSALLLDLYSSPSFASPTGWQSPLWDQQPPWDNVSLVRGTVIPYHAILYLRIPASCPLKNALPYSHLYLKSCFLLLYFNLHPESCPHNKPDSASCQTYCGPSLFFFSRYSHVSWKNG